MGFAGRRWLAELHPWPWWHLTNQAVMQRSVWRWTAGCRGGVTTSEPMHQSSPSVLLSSSSADLYPPPSSQTLRCFLLIIMHWTSLAIPPPPSSITALSLCSTRYDSDHDGCAHMTRLTYISRPVSDQIHPLPHHHRIVSRQEQMLTVTHTHCSWLCLATTSSPVL